MLLLDPGTIALFPLPAFTAGSSTGIEVPIPVQGGLVGVLVACQATVVANGSIAFGGNAPVVTLQ